MSSTSSSAEQVPRRSATEDLARRYRHLFVLPSTPLLLIYAGTASLLFSVVSSGGFAVGSLVPELVILILSISAISSALQITDRKTIANFRRTTAVVLAGEVLWLFCSVCGLLYSWFLIAPNAMGNAIQFGAFVCAGLEFLIINGAFTRNGPLSMGLAAIHPGSTVIVVNPTLFAGHYDPVVFILGTIAFLTIAGFPTQLGKKRTSRGHDAVSLFRSFMKTWAVEDATDLEAIVSDHSEDSQVTTNLLRFEHADGNIFIILPEVHPGPFHPVGSYDLPGVLRRTFEGVGHVMTLHGAGGHEKNLATTSETIRYAKAIRDFALTITPSTGDGTVRGPLYMRIGNATVSASAFSHDVLLTISFAPKVSDDLSDEVQDEITSYGAEAGFKMFIVDAHNSVGAEPETPDLADPGWKELLRRVKRQNEEQFKVAYSHSDELKFPSGGDLTENGIGLLMLDSNQVKSVLVLADANNAIPTLRGEVANALESSGYHLIEFCTSDSHNLAAKGMTVARGYLALGEETQAVSIAKLIVDLARLAETRLSKTNYGSGRISTSVKVIGSDAIEEFAAITQMSSKLGRSYLRFAGVTVGILLLLSLFL